MPAQEILVLFMRWAHALAALLWIGGSLFYLLVLRPAAQRTQGAGTENLSQAMALEFRSWVNLCIGVLMVSGAVLTLTRLTSGTATLPYTVTLAVKILLALIAFLLVWSQQRRRGVPNAAPSRTMASDPAPQTPATQGQSLLSRGTVVLALGIAAVLLADVLRQLVEGSLQGG